jgi:hypothetical protein
MQRMPQTASSVDSNGFDTVLLRAGGWGMLAVLAVGACVYAAQTDVGSARLQVAVSDMVAPDVPARGAKQAPPAPSGPTLAALEAKVERLTTERQRLEVRLAALEHGLEDVTGSVRRQTEKDDSKPAKPPFIEPPVIPQISTLPLPATVASVSAEPPPPETAAVPPSAPLAAAPEAAVPAEAPPEEAPLPPPRPVARSAAHAEYGVELGTAPDMEALRARWLSTKANFGPLLVGLSPIAVKDKRPGSTQLRLMAGPLKNMTAARELCAKFVATNGYCWPTRVDSTDVVQR